MIIALYACIEALTIGAVLIANARNDAPVFFPGELYIWQIFTVLVALLLFGGFVIRRIKLRLFWDLLLTITLFLGVWVFAWFVFPFEIALLIAAVITVLQARLRRVLMHNAFVLIGSAGVALNFAYLFQDVILILFFVTIMIYDTVAGRPKGSIAELAAALIHRGTIPGLIIPEKFQELLDPIKTSIHKNTTFFLGAGDLVLPSILVARATVFHLYWGAAVMLGILFGSVYLFNRKDQKPFPALLPIGFGALIPYLAMLLIHYYGP